MSGALIPADHAGALLDEVVYERVLACLQLPSLFKFELDLWVAVYECGFADEDRARAIASEMIDRALHRIADDEQRYAALQPFGDCDLCEEEASEQRTKKTAS